MKVIEEQWIPPMIIYEKEQKWWSLLKIIYEWEREALGTEDELEELEDDEDNTQYTPLNVGHQKENKHRAAILCFKRGMKRMVIATQFQGVWWNNPTLEEGVEGAEEDCAGKVHRPPTHALEPAGEVHAGGAGEKQLGVQWDAGTRHPQHDEPTVGIQLPLNGQI